LSSYDNFTSQQYFDFGSEGAELVAYVCLDVSQVRILDSSGTDVTPADRPNRLPLEITFVAESSSTMRIDGSELWSGDDFCA